MHLFENGRAAKRYVQSVLIAFVLVSGAAFFPLRSFQVAGESMEPRLADGEKILVAELSPSFPHVERGDILVFRHPRIQSRYLIKRVVGLAGETVEIRHGLLYVDGVRVPEWYLPSAFLDRSDLAPLRLGSTELFVMGDHRNDSEDSRSWGPLPRDLIVGRAILAYWPPSAASYF